MTHDTDRKDEGLLPCPFCGSRRVSRSEGRTGDDKPFFYIECEDCAGNAEPDAWNRRVSELHRKCGCVGDQVCGLCHNLDQVIGVRPTPPTSGEGELREALQTIDKLIVRGPLPGNGTDKTAERNGLVIAYNALDALRSRPSVQPQANVGLVKALEKIRLTPSLPFPDAGAHSWRAFGEAVYRAYCDIQRITRDALAEASKKPLVGSSDAAPSTAPVQEAAAPIDMILFCPRCGHQHVDEPDDRTPDWTNPPHRSHLCHNCNFIWRPADVATNGVLAIKTCGKKDMPYVGSVRAVQKAEVAGADDSEELRERIDRCLENAQVYIDGFDGKNELSVGPHMLREMLGTTAELLARLRSPRQTEVNAELLDLTNVDAESGYHNWIEIQSIPHTAEREQAFKEAWRILSGFIAGPEQQAVDWHIVSEAVHDAADVDGISTKALQGSFAHHGLLVVHKQAIATAHPASLKTKAQEGE